MKVLLLGATGMLGHNVLRCLTAHGHLVRAVVRNAASSLEPSPLLETVTAPELNRSVLLAAADSCEAIVNCAGCTDMGLLRLDDYLPANRDLCQTLLQVMLQRPVRTLVHISTANTLWHGTDSHPGTEEREAAEPFSLSLYEQSKAQGEQLLLQAAKGLADKRIVVLNPGFIIGGGGLHPSSGQLVRMGWRKPLMAAPRGGKSFVAATTVARAAEAALREGRNGERYLITSDNLTFKQFYALCANVGGYRQHIVLLPNWVVRAAGRLGDTLRLAGVKTQLSSVNTALLLEQEHFCSTKAYAELHIEPDPLDEAIRQCMGLANSQ
ncbi:MAG: NAD-dependent epimerase/dehydratase family protein [Bacteroidales bacterium]|nr:NAD-dependent epimerase/dehydratase family protein [Bacteroidales bacterium]